MGPGTESQNSRSLVGGLVIDQKNHDTAVGDAGTAKYWSAVLHNVTKLGFTHHDFQAKGSTGSNRTGDRTRDI